MIINIFNKSILSLLIISSIFSQNFSFKNKRVFYSTISNDIFHNVIYPGTEISCGQILEEYFNTNIFVNSKDNKLISLDGSIFNVGNSATNNDNNLDSLVISNTQSIINTIGNMYYGNSELKFFMYNHPNALE